MQKRRSFRRKTFRRSPYEMQQLTICRTGLTLVGVPTCTEPLQYLTGLVSPRREFAGSGAAGTEVIPAFAKGVTVGGIRFRYRYAINTALATADLQGILDNIAIRSALVVLPLADTNTELPGVFPTNILHTSGTIPETQATAGLGYTRPRILWRSLDNLRFVGQTVTTPGALGSTGINVEQLQSTCDFVTPELQVVKSKVALGHNEALYFLTEIFLGFTIAPPNSAIIVLDLLGVAAVKPTTATR